MIRVLIHAAKAHGATLKEVKLINQQKNSWKTDYVFYDETTPLLYEMWAGSELYSSFSFKPLTFKIWANIASFSGTKKTCDKQELNHY